MKNFLLISLASFLLSCGDEPTTYPKSYTFSRVDQFPEGLFLITSNDPQSLQLNSGTYGIYSDSIKAESAAFIKMVFDLKEIELLSEDMVRVHILIDEEEIDTVVNYTISDKNIIIDALSDTDLIYYDQEEDAFVLCGFATLALPGPNVLNPGQQYYSVTIEDCIENGNLNDHLDYVLSNNEYQPLDTVAIIITRFIYK